MSMQGLGGGRPVIPRDVKAMNLDITRLLRLRNAIVMDVEISHADRHEATDKIDSLVTTLSNILKSKTP